MTADIDKPSCAECNKTFSSAKTFQNHVSSVHTVRISTCDICTQQFRNPAYLNNHRKRVHDTEVAICEVCTKICKSKTSLYHHKRDVHESVQDLSCDLCDEPQRNHNALSKHKRRFCRFRKPKMNDVKEGIQFKSIEPKANEALSSEQKERSHEEKRSEPHSEDGGETIGDTSIENLDTLIDRVVEQSKAEESNKEPFEEEKIIDVEEQNKSVENMIDGFFKSCLDSVMEKNNKEVEKSVNLKEKDDDNDNVVSHAKNVKVSLNDLNKQAENKSVSQQNLDVENDDDSLFENNQDWDFINVETTSEATFENISSLTF